MIYLLTRSIAVNLIGVNLTVLWIVDDTVLGNGIMDATREVVHVVCQVTLITDLCHDFRGRI